MVLATLLAVSCGGSGNFEDDEDEGDSEEEEDAADDHDAAVPVDARAPSSGLCQLTGHLSSPLRLPATAGHGSS
jgi:hypothetical protein